MKTRSACPVTMVVALAVVGPVTFAEDIPDNAFGFDRTKAAHIEVRVDPSIALGAIRDVHGVNNGPMKPLKSQCKGNFEAYRDARIPSARLHDAVFCSGYGGPHVVDVAAVFPDFSADENDPASYDFHYTDELLDTIAAAGTETYYRLGQSIEHGSKKYHVRPKDFAKWARICEHVILHCNEGWANGARRGIRHWEIWNEPDNNPTNNPTCWNGTDAEFRDFFATAYAHLKGRFPNLKIGGPAVGWNEELAEAFLKDMQRRGIKLDFFSWHAYSTDPREVGAKARRMRERMDRYGQRDAESHLTEWNYVRDWGLGWVYSMRTESGDRRHVGAAYVAATLMEMQKAGVDLAHYYDARPGTSMNGLFDGLTARPIGAYYAIWAWSGLKELGTQVATRAMSPEDDVYVASARGSDGRLGVLVSRFDNDLNVILPRRVRLYVMDVQPGRVRAHLTDYHALYTEFRPEREADGALSFILEPNAFAYLEFEGGEPAEGR